MPISLAANRKATELFESFRAVGALPVETEILQPAETLLDLYGEMIRARAFVTEDPLRGEMMLRPDFTVPVVNLHMREGAEPARYTYQGLVFRTQDLGNDRPSEYLQVGYEVFDRTNPANSDAEVFLTLTKALGRSDLRAVMGDMGILTAAVAGLDASQGRRAALMRHIWRPRRFDALLKRFGTVLPPQLDPVTDAPHIGMRTQAEITQRLEALENERKQAPLERASVEPLSNLMTLKTPASKAVDALREIEKKMPAIAPAVDQFAARLDALSTQGVDLEAVVYEGSYGRTSLEYYDGFVFGIYAIGRPDWPPIASGGRYDALTKVLGQGRSIPAVGGVIRPELLTELEAAE